MDGKESDGEAKRLEDLWSGSFGDAYVDRNAGAYDLRGPFWRNVIDRLSPTRVLEVGCNTGGNLRWIAPLLEPASTYGVDINRKALALLHETQPDVNALLVPPENAIALADAIGRLAGVADLRHRFGKEGSQIRALYDRLIMRSVLQESRPRS